ncbi:PAS domain S-box-containing protein [Sedimentibacter acidaminivorans]|uniref:PAS domain S-box-containing protein n=1 Tax=Sedimentibacter acidaminivorans TaxID=913099 RepID=A0ABS4GD23_9FIRM|nr:sigma 54-interacting transcriptional regulator [Sedimentibacter acidaminivorans]MBP1925600.1 PAS domain S-box-containing protein [Sedimentibacter acidaminivorans]
MLDCLIEGILIIDSKNDFVVNKRFEEFFNTKIEEVSEVFDILEKNGLIDLLNIKQNIEKEVIINDRKLIVETLVIDSIEEYSYLLIIFKNIDNTEVENSQIDELKKSINSIKDILDNAYQGIVLINKDGNIIKWNYEKLFGIKEEDVLGKPVQEVIENTRLHIVVKTGQKELYDVQRIQGHNMIASRTPIIKDGEIIGAVGTVLFKDVKEVKDLVEKLKVLENTVDKYKREISNMYCANYTFDDIITQNKNMLKVKDIAIKSANSASTVMIQGESGTGKEYFAHAIHYASQRKDAPFIRVNCAAIPPELFESELFGYDSGAFTGAKKEGKIGKLELANGGTILFDEISSMPYNMQAKLLRVLEERELERVGSNIGIKIDIRIIACTNENLLNLVKEGRFRKDLYYRLNVVRINIPPLRDRLDDIPNLCEDILKQLLKNVGLPYKTVTEKAILAFQLYNWPGNVRELRNILERAANMSYNNYIDLNNLPDYINNILNMEDNNKDRSFLKDIVADVEIKAIMEAINITNGSRTEAAKLLGIHRTALYKKIDNYGINIKAI